MTVGVTKMTNSVSLFWNFFDLNKAPKTGISPKKGTLSTLLAFSR